MQNLNKMAAEPSLFYRTTPSFPQSLCAFPVNKISQFQFNRINKTTTAKESRNTKGIGSLIFVHSYINLVRLQSNKKYKKKLSVYTEPNSFSKAFKLCSPAGGLLKAMSLAIRQ
jgi:hypothetical protein